MTERQFFKYWFLATALMLLFAMLLNRLVDPYLIYGQPLLEGVNKIKPEAGTRSRISKIYMARQSSARVLVAGNSRPELGIDPQSQFFSAYENRVYNLGIRGASPRMQLGYSLDVARDLRPDLVMIGVDFLDYLNAPGARQGDDDWRLSRPNYEKRLKYSWAGDPQEGYLFESFLEHVQPVVSLSGLFDSVVTLTGQNSGNPTLRKDGFNPPEYFLAQTKFEGVEALFTQKNMEMAPRFSRPAVLVGAGGGVSHELEQLDAAIGELVGLGSTVIVFINPYHAHYISMIELSGKWQQFEQWKQRLTAIVGQHAEVVLWDFSNLGSWDVEPVLGAERTPLKWYWEPAHYRRELGELMVEQMISQADSGPGTRLNEATIDSHLKEGRLALQHFAQEFPLEMRYVKRFFGRDL